MTEWEVAGMLASACARKKIDAIVQLIAADERCDTVRHPLPTSKIITSRVMVVLCGRREGLIVSLTRVASFVPLSAELVARHEAVTYVDAVILAQLKEDAVASEIFSKAVAAYAEKGYANEWTYHHQGGCAGYLGREWFASPQSQKRVRPSQGFAWNPSIAGIKSEDTVLLLPSGDVEVISASPEWPVITQTVDGRTFDRPAILELC